MGEEGRRGEVSHFIIPAATQDFMNNYGHSNDYSLSDVLWTCSSMLSNR